MQQQTKIIVQHTGSAYERERLSRPFGFKGGALTELWQAVVSLTAESGQSALGLGTQSVLYGDASFFAANPEAKANAFMYTLTASSLEIVKKTPFVSPPELLKSIMPEVKALAQHMTSKKDLHPNFILNALIPIEHAAWLLYARQQGIGEFEKMIPAAYQQVLNQQHQKIAIIYQVSYNLPVHKLKQAVEEGYFIFKIKLGQAGSEAEMLQKDMDRMRDIHNALKDERTSQTQDNKVIYTMDANGRFSDKESIKKLIDHADKLGMREQILLFEEPLAEHNDAFMGDLGVRIGADESLHNVERARQRVEQGYGAFVLKSIAKTMSLTLEVAEVAVSYKIPCLCADLTVNPILLCWHQNLAARLPAFPGMDGTGVMETNGRENYMDWEKMLSYHPIHNATWLRPQYGVFRLGKDFYRNSGGVFKTSQHYLDILRQGEASELRNPM